MSAALYGGPPVYVDPFAAARAFESMTAEYSCAGCGKLFPSKVLMASTRPVCDGCAATERAIKRVSDLPPTVPREPIVQVGTSDAITPNGRVRP